MQFIQNVIIVHTLLILNNIASNNSKVYKKLIQELLIYLGYFFQNRTIFFAVRQAFARFCHGFFQV